jgi:hypothetical protein
MTKCIHCGTEKEEWDNVECIERDGLKQHEPDVITVEVGDKAGTKDRFGGL